VIYFYEDHEGFPVSTEEAAVRWSTAFNAYASSVVPSSTTSSLAKSACESVLLSQLSATNPSALEVGFTAYVNQLALGMQPTFTAVAPIGLSLASAFAVGIAGGSAESVATLMSGLIDVWFRTGTATNNSSGVTVPWS